MKKSVLLFLSFLCATFAYSQKESYFSVSLKGDIKNSTIGSQPTEYKASPDLILGLHMVSENVEVNSEVESFDKIGYFSFGVNGGYHLQRYLPITRKGIDITVIPLIGAKVIYRYGFEDKLTDKNPDGIIYGSSQHLALQVGSSFRIPLSDKFLIDFSSVFSTRSDINYRWNDNKIGVLSNYLGIHYKF